MKHCSEPHKRWHSGEKNKKRWKREPIISLEEWYFDAVDFTWRTVRMLCNTRDLALCFFSVEIGAGRVNTAAKSVVPANRKNHGAPWMREALVSAALSRIYRIHWECLLVAYDGGLKSIKSQPEYRPEIPVYGRYESERIRTSHRHPPDNRCYMKSRARKRICRRVRVAPRFYGIVSEQFDKSLRVLQVARTLSSAFGHSSSVTPLFSFSPAQSAFGIIVLPPN